MAKKNSVFDDDVNVYSKEFRTKQFLPFNSLRGYCQMVKEKEIVLQDRKKLAEDELEILQEKFQCISKGMMVKVKYYYKVGYTTLVGMVANIDIIYRTITIVKTKISFDDIIDIGVC